MGCIIQPSEGLFVCHHLDTVGSLLCTWTRLSSTGLERTTKAQQIIRSLQTIHGYM